MNDQIGIDVVVGGRKLKAYMVRQFATSFYLRAMNTIRIAQRLPDGTESIDTDIDCGMMEKNRLVVDDVGFMEMDNKKYILLELKPKSIIT